ncbi:MAG: LuxR C-terminal-related transcriptional regulator [Thermoleophilia bacterium]
MTSPRDRALPRLADHRAPVIAVVPTPARLVVATSMPVLAAGIDGWLAGTAGWSVAARAVTPASLRAALSGGADLVVGAPRLAGTDLCDQVARSAPGTPVLVLAEAVDADAEAALLARGAAGVIGADATRRRLRRAVADVLAGRCVASTAAVRLLADRDRPPPLTARQAQILRLLAQGLSTEEIARRTIVAPTTVKTHVARLAARFGLAGRRELAARAAELLSDPWQRPGA